MSTIQTHTDQNGYVFEVHAREVAQRVRRALAELVAGVGADATKPQLLARRLGLDKNLAWKASKIVTDENPLTAIPRLPGRSGQRILLDAFADAGASKASLDAARDAMAEVEKMMEKHAGNRETLEMMLAGLSPRGQAERDEAHRRMSLLGNSATWGVQARAQVSAHFLAPAKEAGRIRLACVCGLVDFRRLRADVPWAVATVRMIHDDGSSRGEGWLPLDPRSKPPGPPIMVDYCSDPLPPLRVAKGRAGAVRYELGEGAVGNAGAATCITGWESSVTESQWRTPEDRYGENFVHLYTPAEVLLHDLYVHESLEFAMQPTVHLYSALPGGPVYPADGRDRGLLPLNEEILDMGSPPDLTTPELPRYAPMIEAAIGQMGFRVGEFRGFRVRLRYPPIPTLLVYRYELPELTEPR